MVHLPPPVRVPCHLDFTPRNWLISGSQVSVVDFEEVRADAWVNDLSRLYFGWWPRRPELRAAFLDGYGHQPTGDELALLRGSYGLTAVRHIVLARHLGKRAIELAVHENLKALMSGPRR